MLLYNKSCGKVLAGLTNRRKAERELFLSGSINNGGNKFMIDNEMPVISYGSTGAAVGTLQILLKYKGYKGSNGKVLSIQYMNYYRHYHYMIKEHLILLYYYNY